LACCDNEEWTSECSRGVGRHIMAAHRSTVTWLAVKEPINRIFIPDIPSEIKHTVSFYDTF